MRRQTLFLPPFPCPALLPPSTPSPPHTLSCVQVLDYQNVSHTLLPLLAAAYVLRFMGDEMVKMYRQFEQDRWVGWRVVGWGVENRGRRDGQDVPPV